MGKQSIISVERLESCDLRVALACCCKTKNGRVAIPSGTYMENLVTIGLAVGLVLVCLSPIGGICQSSSAKPGSPAIPTTTLRDAGTAKDVIIGTAADPGHLGETPYAATLSTEFRQLEPENQMKFGPNTSSSRKRRNSV